MGKNSRNAAAKESVCHQNAVAKRTVPMYSMEFEMSPCSNKYVTVIKILLLKEI